MNLRCLRKTVLILMFLFMNLMCCACGQNELKTEFASMFAYIEGNSELEIDGYKVRINENTQTLYFELHCDISEEYIPLSEVNSVRIAVEDYLEANEEWFNTFDEYQFYCSLENYYWMDWRPTQFAGFYETEESGNDASGKYNHLAGAYLEISYEDAAQVLLFDGIEEIVLNPVTNESQFIKYAAEKINEMKNLRKIYLPASSWYETFSEMDLKCDVKYYVV